MILPTPWPRRLSFASILLLMVYLGWLMWGRVETLDRLLLGGLSQLGAALLAAALVIMVARRVDAARRRTWLFLSAAALLLGVGTVLRMVNTAPALNLAVLCSVVAMGLLYPALLSYPHTGRIRLGGVSLVSDLIISTAAISALLWMVFLRPLLVLSTGLPLDLLPVIADLAVLLLMLVLFLLSAPERFSSLAGWLGVLILVRLSSDMAFYSVRLVDGYQPAGTLELGWLLSSFCLIFAANRERIDPLPRTGWARRMLISLQTLLPLASGILLFWFALIGWQTDGSVEPVDLWIVLIVGVGLIARQGILTGEIELQKYASLVNSVAEPAFVCDGDGRLRLVNPALLAAAGYTAPLELLNQPLQSMIQSAADAGDLIDQGVHGGWSGEVGLRRRDGTLLPVSLALRPLRSGRGGRLALAGTAHDLSEIKRQQAALQAAYEQIAADRTELEHLNVSLEQKVAEKTASLTEAYHRLEEQNLALQKLDVMKSDFVSLVSHELRAPLTNINGGLELYVATQPDLPSRQRGTLGLVQNEIKRLTRFVETILDLSALDAGRMPLYPAPLTLHVITAHLRDQLLSPEAAGRIRWAIPPTMPPLLADDQALTSVLFHLLDNALKYAPQGEIHVEAGTAGERAWLQVRDQGPGIPPEALPLIFNQFYRSNPTDSQTVYGHGLGLYIVRRLLEGMQGEITVENLPQGGACFTCWLPLTLKGEDDARQDSAGG